MPKKLLKVCQFLKAVHQNKTQDQWPSAVMINSLLKQNQLQANEIFNEPWQVIYAAIATEALAERGMLDFPYHPKAYMGFFLKMVIFISSLQTRSTPQRAHAIEEFMVQTQVVGTKDKCGSVLGSIFSSIEQQLESFHYVQKRYLSDPSTGRVLKVLQDLSDNGASYPSLWQAQNALVHRGMEWTKADDPLFPFGAPLTLTEVLTYDQNRWFIHFLALKFAAFQPSSGGTNILGSSDLSYYFSKQLLEGIASHQAANKPFNVTVLFQVAKKVLAEAGMDITTELLKNLQHWQKEMNGLAAVHQHYQRQWGVKSTQAVRILVLGDSVSAGLGIEDQDKRWVMEGMRLLKNDGLAVQLANCSIPGYETPSGLKILEREIAGHAPDIILITLGGNDVARLTPVAAIERYICQMIAIGQAQAKQMIFGAGIPKTFEDSFGVDKSYRSDFEAMIRRIGQMPGVAIVPLPDEVLEAVLPDGLHFNEVAQALIAQLMQQALKPLILKHSQAPRLSPAATKPDTPSAPLNELPSTMLTLYKAKQQLSLNQSSASYKPKPLLSRL